MVSSGNGLITQTSSQLTVNQGSQNLAINWQSFDIAPTQTVNFKQPNSNAIALNRVTGQNPSSILGNLNANGQVFLINPNGILFGQTAQVSVGGLVASTLNLSDSDFNSGNYKFSGSSTASIINNGTLSAATGGYVALLGANVSNLSSGAGSSGGGNGNGTGNAGSTGISAYQGNVSLAAGQDITLQLANGSLLGLTVNQGALNAVAQNSGVIKADGGQILLTAQAANALTTAVVNNTGVLEAQTVGNHNGQISLVADMNVGTVNASGTLDPSAPHGGSGGKVNISGNTININSALSWNSNNTLTISGANSINLNAPITATNAGSLVLSYNTPYGLNFLGNNISFTNVVGGITQGALTINAQPYTLVNSVSQLATKAASNPNGFYALANNYNAGSDGTYSSTPISSFGGTFNGLGNAISNLSIVSSGQNVGLFGVVGTTGKILNLGLSGGSVTSTALGVPPIAFSAMTTVGGLVGHNFGTITNVYSTGSVAATGNYSLVGGLIGLNDGGTITNAHATGTVSGVIPYTAVGGLVGYNLNGGVIANTDATGTVAGGMYSGGLVGINNTSSTITNSYATGAVSGGGAVSVLGGTNIVGGLVGENDGLITSSYATGNVVGAANSYTGGLVGINFSNGQITTTYATGNVTGGANSILGGLVGWNYKGVITSSYATGIVTGGLGSLIGSLIGFNTP